MSAFAAIYRAVFPHAFRTTVFAYRKALRLHRLKQKVIRHYKRHETTDPEIRSALEYLKEHPLAVFPYNFAEKYSTSDVHVEFDNKARLHFVHFEGHRLYFAEHYSEDQVKHAFTFLLSEQDPESPHRYLADGFELAEGSVLADVGCAEGIFSLMNIRKVSHVHLFEADPRWIRPLQLTFSPWKDKVTIVNAFVSDNDANGNIRLDDYFRDETPDFLKIDVDGAEENLLSGSRRLLSKKNISVALCTYHKQQDAEKFRQLFDSMGFTISFSKKYMLFYFSGDFGPPYFRRGLIRAING
jgi:hypothetical protein